MCVFKNVHAVMNTDKMTVHFLNQATCRCIVHISVDTALDRWYIYIISKAIAFYLFEPSRELTFT